MIGFRPPRRGMPGRCGVLPAPGAHTLRSLRTVALLVALSVLPFLFLLPLFGAPFERDQGTYATIARGWRDGLVPYRDLWDNKGPLLFLWYMVSFSWLGETIVAPRVAAGIVAGSCVPFVWATTTVLLGRRTAAWAALLFALSFLDVYLQVTANAEVFMLLPMTAGWWAFAMGATGGRKGWYVVAGVLTTLAVFTRQSAVWMFVGYGLWLVATWWRDRDRLEGRQRRGRATDLVALAAGGLLGTVPFALYFGWQGAAADLWQAMFGFNLSFAAAQSFWQKFVPPLLTDPTSLLGGLLFWALVAIGIWRLWRRGDRSAWLVLAVLVVSEAAAQTTGKGSAHYVIQLLPAAAIAAAFAVPFVTDRWRDRRLAMALVACATLTAAALLFAYLQPSAQDRFLAQYSFGPYARDATAAPAIASAVAAMSTAEDCVYEWGRSSQIYFLADRTPCSRWFHDRPYELDTSVLDEIMADFAARPPAVIVVTTGEDAPVELQALIERDYLPAGHVEYAALYRRTDGSAP
jgi:4-amino-4-deoxy-L-arabinose transferase-like glycosyltransferase